MLLSCQALFEKEDEEIKHLFNSYLALYLQPEEVISFQCTLLTEFIEQFYTHCLDLALPILEILTNLLAKINIQEVQKLLATYLTYINFYSKLQVDIQDHWQNPFMYNLSFDNELDNTYSVILMNHMNRHAFQDVLLAYNRSTYLKPAYLSIIYHSEMDNYFTNDLIVLLDILSSDYGREENNKIHNWISICLDKFKAKPIVHIYSK